MHYFVNYDHEEHVEGYVYLLDFKQVELDTSDKNDNQ